MTPEILSDSSRNSVRLLPQTLPDYPAKILLRSLPKSENPHPTPRPNLGALSFAI